MQNLKKENYRMLPKGIIALILSLFCLPNLASTQTLEISCAECLVIDVASLTNVPAGITAQDIIDGWYDEWYDQFTFVDNGCNPVASGLEGQVAPSAISGGLVTITFMVIDECGNEEFCTSTFEIIGSEMDPIIVSCPPSVVMPVGSTQIQIDSAFSLWINAFTAIPSNAITTDLSGIISPRPSDPSIDITFVAEDPNDATNTGSCGSTFTPPTATIIDMNDEIPTMGEWGIFSLLLCLLILSVKSIRSSEVATI